MPNRRVVTASTMTLGDRRNLGPHWSRSSCLPTDDGDRPHLHPSGGVLRGLPMVLRCAKRDGDTSSNNWPRSWRANRRTAPGNGTSHVQPQELTSTASSTPSAIPTRRAIVERLSEGAPSRFSRLAAPLGHHPDGGRPTPAGARRKRAGAHREGSGGSAPAASRRPGFQPWSDGSPIAVRCGNDGSIGWAICSRSPTRVNKRCATSNSPGTERLSRRFSATRRRRSRARGCRVEGKAHRGC